jgi:hypothetical protein
MMKKVALSLAGVMAAATFAPQASALPVFARQTGMACNACHFQHFPMLNAFGRSFKASGFTLMGAEGKVEGENLSIPATLNMAVLTTAGYTRTNASNPAPGIPGANLNGNGWYVPGTNGEFSLFVGGRVSDFAGGLAEIGAVGPAGLASAKLPILFDVGNGTRAGVVLYTTDSHGPSYGFEYLNTGANDVHTMQFVAGDSNGSITSLMGADEYIGTNSPATGFDIVANNDMGFINIGKYHMGGPGDFRSLSSAGGVSAKLGSTYARIAGTFDLAGWDSAVGIQSWSGSSVLGANATGILGANAILALVGAPPITGAATFNTKATAIDGQMQGQLGGMPVGFYASYARAPSSTPDAAGNFGNMYNPGGDTSGLKRDSFNISTEIGVIPEKATISVALRRSKSGYDTGLLNGPTRNGNNASDNGYLIGASYKLAQNMILQFDYTHASGDFWTSNAAGNGNAQTIGTSQTALSLSTIF